MARPPSVAKAHVRPLTPADMGEVVELHRQGFGEGAPRDELRTFLSDIFFGHPQRKETRTPNILDLEWARAFVEGLRRIHDEGFAGVLSALWVGDTLAAAHFGIRTGRVLHYWIPAYNHELGRYSPGLLALMELARAAADRGIHRIAGLRAVNHALDHIRTWSRGSRIGALARATGREVTRGSFRVQSALASTSLLSGSGSRAR